MNNLFRLTAMLTLVFSLCLASACRPKSFPDTSSDSHTSTNQSSVLSSSVSSKTDSLQNSIPTASRPINSTVSGNNTNIKNTGAKIKDATPLPVPSNAIDVTKNGVVANSSAAAVKNTSALNNIIKKAKSGDTIYFPKGDYYIYSSVFSHITISGKSELTILGKEANLINASYSPSLSGQFLYYAAGNIFDIKNSSNIIISGLTFDYEKQVNICGVITEVSQNKTIFKAYDEFLNGNCGVKGNEPIWCINVFNTIGQPQAEQYLDSSFKLDVIDATKGLFSVSIAIGSVGQQVCARFGSMSVGVAPLISTDGVKGMKIHNVQVRSCPGMIVLATGENADFTFDSLKVASEKNSKQLFASNADCMHIKGLKGTLKLTNCSFIGIGDDALNTHVMAGVINKIDQNTVTIVNGATSEALTNWASVGDSVDIYDAEMNLLCSAKVVNVSSNKLELDNLPTAVGLKCMLHNLSRVPTVKIDNCLVKRSRARGFLIQAPNATITNCTFEDLGLAGILIAPDTSYWYEMGPCQNAVIKNNLFKNCCLHLNLDNYGVITAALNHNPIPVKTTAKPHGIISITNNKIVNSNCNAVYIYGVKSTTVKNNDFSKQKVTIK